MKQIHDVRVTSLVETQWNTPVPNSPTFFALKSKNNGGVIFEIKQIMKCDRDNLIQTNQFNEFYPFQMNKYTTLDFYT